MIRVINAKSYRELRILGPAPTPTRIPHVARAVPPDVLTRLEKPIAVLAKRFGANATSSLLSGVLAELGPAHAHALTVVVRDFGAGLVWVEAGNAMMRPGRLQPWFIDGDAWLAEGSGPGLSRLIRENADAVLSAPRAVVDAMREAYRGELKLEGEPSVDGRRVALTEATFHGCSGPATLDVDQGQLTIDTVREVPWNPIRSL
ncbi:MAG: hypothetical protein QM817_14145 [Archangium sp.]